MIAVFGKEYKWLKAITRRWDPACRLQYVQNHRQVMT